MNWNKIRLIFGCVILVFFAICAIMPGIVAPYGLKEMDAPWLSVSSAHLLGTNDLGYDIFTELIYASRYTLLVGIAAAFVSLVIGSSFGLAAGFLPMWKGEIVNGFIQIFLTFPMLPLAIVIAAFCGKTMFSIMMIIAVLGWCGTARVVKARTMQLKQSQFVEALSILGISRSRIIIKHIIPNIREVVLSRYLMSVAACMMMEATLSFLGLGDPTEVTWGRMINLAYKCGGFSRGAYNWLISPGICIMLIVIAFYCISSYIESKSDQVSDAASFMD